MSRPQTYEKRISSAIRLTPELHARISDVAKARDVSINLLVCKAIEQFLDRLIPVDQLLQTRSEEQ